MTVPNEAKLKLARAVCASEVRIVWVAGAALSPLLGGSVERRAVAGGVRAGLASWGQPSGPARSTDGQRWG